jgi:hypothetical protein
VKFFLISLLCPHAMVHIVLLYFLLFGHSAETVISYMVDISISEEFSLLGYNAM